jgi:hypothetical protein
MRKLKTFNELLEGNRLPKNLYDKLLNIVYSIKDNISVAKAEEVSISDLDDLIIEYWDDDVDLSLENIQKVKELIGDIKDIAPSF